MTQEEQIKFDKAQAAFNLYTHSPELLQAAQALSNSLGKFIFNGELTVKAKYVTDLEAAIAKCLPPETPKP